MDLTSRHGLCRITGEPIEAVKYRTQLRECVEGAMGSLREFEALLCSEQPLDEAVQLLSANERDTDNPPLLSRISTRTNQNGALLS